MSKFADYFAKQISPIHFSLFSVQLMVLILDGNSEHDACVWLFWNKFHIRQCSGSKEYVLIISTFRFHFTCAEVFLSYLLILVPLSSCVIWRKKYCVKRQKKREIFYFFFVNTEFPKIYRKAVLHRLKYPTNLYLSRCSADLW